MGTLLAVVVPRQSLPHSPPHPPMDARTFIAACPAFACVKSSHQLRESPTAFGHPTAALVPYCPGLQNGTSTIQGEHFNFNDGWLFF